MKPAYRIALAGNPNTGKSTLFNVLTGMKQHTGNWAGKTVVRAEGEYTYAGATYRMIDLPGTYSLFSNSADEEVARDYIVLEDPDVTVVVVDATSLERHLNLALQVMEMTQRVVLCINLIDEAAKLGIEIRENRLAERLGIPVVKISARAKRGLRELQTAIAGIADGSIVPQPRQIRYAPETEAKIKELEPEILRLVGDRYPLRWLALRVLDGDDSILEAIGKHTGKSPVRQGGTIHEQSFSH